jgi:1-deoxy-D-xylulose-5-phosphate reductoisomerase
VSKHVYRAAYTRAGVPAIVARLPKRIAILGSTGSIGTNALDVIDHLGDGYRTVALSAHRQAGKLLEQARRCRPAAVAVTHEAPDETLLKELRATGADVYAGPGAMERLVSRDDVDLVLAAVVGAAGLPAVLAAVRAGKSLALANKESLVVAGSLLVPEARRRGVPIIPVDSEHSAIFQAMQCGRLHEVQRVILTASGGPFRNAPADFIETATPEDALKHPTWRMGHKITIDSATMFNKALELIEACWLFDLPPEKIEVVIHPESVIHSMVEFVDGSVIAQLSPPDMRTPIQFALTHPERRPGRGRRLNLRDRFALHFEPPDPARFPALRLAYDVARMGGTAGAVLNAANEAAVAAFTAREIPFGEISRLVEITIARHRDGLQQNPSLSDLLDADRWARDTVRGAIGERRPPPKPLASK